MTMEYTIILVSEKSGKNYSFKLRLSVLIFLAALFLGMIAVTYFASSEYFTLHQKNNTLQAMLKQSKQDIHRLESEKKEAVLYGKWADRIIFRRTHNRNKTSHGIMQQDASAPPPEKHKTEPPRPSILDIDAFKISRINLEKDFDYTFRLVNTDSDHLKKSGYLFIITSSRIAPQQIFSSPPSELTNGRPVNHEDGAFFSIRFLKKISGRIVQPDIGEKYDLFTILAYSEDGNLLMKKVYSIDPILNRNPYE